MINIFNFYFIFYVKFNFLCEFYNYRSYTIRIYNNLLTKSKRTYIDVINITTIHHMLKLLNIILSLVISICVSMCTITRKKLTSLDHKDKSLKKDNLYNCLIKWKKTIALEKLIQYIYTRL